MNRRLFLFAAFASLVTACAPTAGNAAPFEPSRFSVEVRGSGRDVILIPGLSSGREVWRATAAGMPGHRYHLIQVSGFAGEPARGNNEGAILAPLADEIARYIADRRLASPAIVGHSMGGTLAMMIAARHPSLTGKIMVVDMLPRPAGLFGAAAVQEGPLARSLRNMISTPGGQRLIGGFLAAFSPPSSGYNRSDPEVVGRALHELANLDLTPQLARIRVPMTVVYASPNPESQVAIDQDFAGAYASARAARLVRIEGSGHMVMLDQPARFRSALSDFLAN